MIDDIQIITPGVGRPKGSKDKLPRVCLARRVRPARHCAYCGGSFTRKKGNFCSRQCSYDAMRTKPEVATCEACGVWFKTKGGGNNARACSRACGFEVIRIDNRRKKDAEVVLCDHPPTPSTCANCSSLFISQLTSAKACSEECRHAIKIKSIAVRRMSLKPRRCVTCGVAFIKKYKGANTSCSIECYNVRQAKVKRIHRSKRDKRLRDATIIGFDPLRVLERDKWKCQLCGIRTPKRLRGSYLPNAPELDHIIPLALGGAHAEWNTQCLCRKCNGDKSATTAGQLRLAI